MRIGIMLSGNGTNFEAIAKNVHSGIIPATIPIVLSNKNCNGLKRAANFNIPYKIINSDSEIIEELKKHKIDLVVLAGYMKILSPEIVNKFKIMNIHPSLLPSFKGLNAVQQALDYGVTITGCTVHWVDEGVDTGEIILQKHVPVSPDDTLEDLKAKIHIQEYFAYTEAIQNYISFKNRSLP